MISPEAITRFLDPVALGLVFGGAFASAAWRSTRGDLVAAVRSLRALVRADTAADEDRAMAEVAAIERVVESRSRAWVDRLDQRVPFVALAARALAEAEDASAFARWTDGEQAALARRHARAQGVWRAVADAAPAMGMLGTVIGLSAMFARMDDPAAIGPGMAVAMLTTFHGLLLSAGIAGPIAARLERLSAAETEWRALVTARLARVAEAEFTRPRAKAKLRLVE